MSTAEGETLLVPTAAQENLALSREPDVDVFNRWSPRPAVLVGPGHLSMLPYAMGQHLFIHNPFLVLSFGLSEHLPWLCMLSDQPFSLPQRFLVF